MEDEGCEKQASIQFRSRKIVSGVAKAKLNDSHSAAAQITKADGDPDSGNSLEFPTPEKPEFRARTEGTGSLVRKGNQRPVESLNAETTNKKDSSLSEISESGPPVIISSPEDYSIELPEKYKTLSILFDRMVTSIRLLHLRKRLPTFHNISAHVEILSKRKFLCNHLAQMKYTFPEAIQIEKIRVHDEKSLCMNVDMKITLIQDITGCPLYPSTSASRALSQAFQARLIEFFTAHSKGTDIPEAELPEPFNQRNNIALSLLSEGLPGELSQQTSADLESFLRASHFPPSFQNHFSRKNNLPETERAELLVSPAPSLLSCTNDEGMEVRRSPQMKIDFSSVVKFSNLYTQSGMAPQCLETTPTKCSSTTNSLMTETPAILTPKRPMPTPQEAFVTGNEKSVAEPKLFSSVRRPLSYSPSKTGGSLSDPDACISVQGNIDKYACKSSMTSITSTLGEEINKSYTTGIEVKRDIAAGTFKGHEMGQTGQGKNHAMLACLLGVFDTICLISRTNNCSMITKQELVHKIIINNLEIEETREVEENLGLLERFVPDWISKKAVSSGDILYSIERASDPESIRERILEVL